MKQFLSTILFLAAILSCSVEGLYMRAKRLEHSDKAKHVQSNFYKDMLEYYGVIGRGRYGKRQLNLPDDAMDFSDGPVFDPSINDDLFDY